jgi:hypothetical protein
MYVFGQNVISKAVLSLDLWYGENPMRERDIRSVLREALVAGCRNEASTLIIDELGICSGVARVDIAVVNGELKGFEIKSDQDNLGRLPSQTHMYGKVFDTMTIVSGPRHLSKLEASIPGWWGIVAANPSGSGNLGLQTIRCEAKNSSHDPLSVAQLLWREEVLSELRQAGKAKGLSNRPRRYLWDALVSTFSLSELRRIVRTRLKSRENWRAG